MEETYQEQELKPNKTTRSLKKDEVNEYNRKKYHERMSKFEEKVIFNRINKKYEQRERRLKGTIDDNELEEKKNRNQADQVQELYQFFQKNVKARLILKSENKDLYNTFISLEEKEKDEKTKYKRRYEDDEEKESSICICEFDINCKYCEDVFENERCLNDEGTWTKEEEREFEEKELEEYRRNKRIERNRKRKEKVEEARKPLPPLPLRDLCLYEKIREDNISQRKREWAERELEWEESEELRQKYLVFH